MSFQRKPPVLPVLICLVLAVLLAAMNCVFLIAGGGLIAVAGTALPMVSATACFYGYKNIVKERKAIREKNFRAWLAADHSAGPSGPSWDAIEQAIDALIQKGVEPTYERACDEIKKSRPIRYRQPREVIASVYAVPPAMLGTAEQYPQLPEPVGGHTLTCPNRGLMRADRVYEVMNPDGVTVEHRCKNCGNLLARGNESFHVDQLDGSISISIQSKR